MAQAITAAMRVTLGASLPLLCQNYSAVAVPAVGICLQQHSETSLVTHFVAESCSLSELSRVVAASTSSSLVPWPTGGCRAPAFWTRWGFAVGAFQN